MKKATYVLALDQGTTSSRCILFDKKGRLRASAQKEFKQLYPQAGWVEHDPQDILSTQLGVISEVLIRAKITPDQIAAIGITNQRETTIVWDRFTGEPVYNAIVWQCRRTAPQVDELVERGHGEMITAKTGLIPDAYFSASKIAWILNNVPNARQRAERGELLFGTVDTWLIWNLTNGAVHATDYTNASRTMLFNIHSCAWDDELLKLWDIPVEMLPEVRSSSASFGRTDHLSIASSIPICGVAGDQQAALFGQCAFKPGDVKNTYGTGCFLLMNTGENAVRSQNGLLTTIAIGLDGKASYALEGSVFVAGALIQWLRDELGIIKNASETCKIAQQVPDTAGTYIVPAFTGLGAPYWDPYARAAIYGLTRGTTRAHIVRASLEALAYQTCDVITTMEQDSGIELSLLKVDGGASTNDFLLDFQASILGKPVLRPQVTETTALGAAYLAGLYVGYWDDLDCIASNWSCNAKFEPNFDIVRREQLLAGWHDAVRRTLSV